MKAYKYKGVDGHGERIAGEATRESIEDVERKLSPKT